jgi:hypothetical protein
MGAASCTPRLIAFLSMISTASLRDGIRGFVGGFIMRLVLCCAIATVAVMSSAQLIRPTSGPIHFLHTKVGSGDVSSQSSVNTVYQTSQLLPMQYVSDAAASGEVIDDLHFQGLQLNSLGQAEITSITFGFYVLGTGGSLDINLNIYDDSGSGSTPGALLAGYTVSAQAVGTTFLTVQFATGLGPTVTGPDNWMGLHFSNYSTGITDAGWILAASPPVIGTSADLYVDGTGATITSPWSGNPIANFDPVINATPEPASVAVPAAGLVGLLVRRKRAKAD